MCKSEEIGPQLRCDVGIVPEKHDDHDDSERDTGLDFGRHEGIGQRCTG
jgi:hypothetical protein